MNNKVMPEEADNKRPEEQQSIALEQEELKDEEVFAQENTSEKDDNEQPQDAVPVPHNNAPHPNENEVDKKNNDRVSEETSSMPESTPSEDTTDAESTSAVTDGKESEEPAPVAKEATKAKDETTQQTVEETSSMPESTPSEDTTDDAESTSAVTDTGKESEEPAPVAKEASKAKDETTATEETTTQQTAEVPAQESSSKSADDYEDESDDESEEDDYHDDDEQIDYSHFNKKQLTEAIEALLRENDIRAADRTLKEIKPYFDEIESEEYNVALENFLAEGGEKDGFAYKSDKLSERFHEAFKKLKDRKTKHFAELEAEKDANLHAKQALLEKLRNLVDGEETNQSINQLKSIQQEWKSIGPAPKKYAKSLWASYNALVYRFYDNISIYYELKELDRKKNLEAKLQLCERAEGLVEQENIKEVIKELDTLHEEFKHIGPVPKEEQEPLWERFKAASDAIHDRRREYVDQLKEDLLKNLEGKKALAEKVHEFSDFESESIKAWNEKTREIRELQSQWEAIGGMPRDQAKEVNKAFWSGFKKFFANKGLFFKKLDSMREDNLKKKEELVERAQALKDSTDWQRTANELKQLQQDWKDIGPVPEKQRDAVYKKFKAACDEFFNNRRASFREEEKDYEKNLQAKEEICRKIEALAAEKSSDVDALFDLNESYQEIGFVPKKSIKTIQKKYEQAIEKFLANADELDKEEKQEIKINLQFSKLKNSPNSERKLGNKEMFIRKQISKLEDDLSVWKNNLNFFADSKQADKLKAEFGKKIEKADAEVKKLKQQLRVLRDM